LVILIEANNVLVAVFQGDSCGSLEVGDTTPLQLGNPSFRSKCVTDDVVLSAVQQDLEVRDNGLAKEPGVVLGIAVTNIIKEGIISAINAVLISDVGVNTVSSLDTGEFEPIIVGD
jgi:hypothetical protein